MKPALSRGWTWLFAWTALAAPARAQAPTAPADYAVVVAQQALADPAWKAVVDTVVTKHQGRVLSFVESMRETLPALKAQFPRYVCFVAPPELVTREYLIEAHRLSRRLDADPYADCFWGILTGYDATNALHIARQSQPLTIRKVASGTELAMDMVEEGVWYCELNKNKMVQKLPGRAARELRGPDDTTESLVKLLNEYGTDLFATSGHATEHDWQIGFRYRNGSFKHADGVLFGQSAEGRKFPIHSPNPKVYLPIGNCLMGHIDQRDCMATAWMNSAGVCQMLGYIQPTWYGYMGWGVLDYFVEQPGRYTFTEAFFANHHALIHRLATFFPELVEADADVNGRATIAPKLSDKAKVARLTLNDARGLLFDRDMVVFYGDPAWVARMADRPKAFDQSLRQAGNTYVFEIKPQRGADSFKAINLNGSQRGGRPFLAYLPHRVGDVQVTEGAELDPVVTDDFILVPNPRTCDTAKTYRVSFTAKRVP
jgi:zinc protease